MSKTTRLRIRAGKGSRRSERRTNSAPCLTSATNLSMENEFHLGALWTRSRTAAAPSLPRSCREAPRACAGPGAGGGCSRDQRLLNAPKPAHEPRKHAGSRVALQHPSLNTLLLRIGAPLGRIVGLGSALARRPTRPQPSRRGDSTQPSRLIASRREVNRQRSRNGHRPACRGGPPPAVSRRSSPSRITLPQAGPAPCRPRAATATRA